MKMPIQPFKATGRQDMFPTGCFHNMNKTTSLTIKMPVIAKKAQ